MTKFTKNVKNPFTKCTVLSEEVCDIQLLTTDIESREENGYMHIMRGSST